MILSGVFSSPICPGAALLLRTLRRDLEVTENDCILGSLQTLLSFTCAVLFWPCWIFCFVCFVLLVGFCFFLRQEVFCIALTVLELAL